MKKIIGLFVLLAVLLTGCSSMGMDSNKDLLRPPRPSGEKAEIQRALEEHAGKEIILKYPREGDFRSAIITTDLDGDEGSEALVFYRAKIESAGTHFIFMVKQDGEWVVKRDLKIEASDVERVVFSDFDGDGVKEIFLGWNTYSKDNMAEVYQWTGGQLKALMSGYLYTVSCVADFDGDGRDEIAAVNLNNTEQTSQMELFKMQKGNMEKMGQASLDGNVSSYSLVTFGRLNKNGLKGMVLDGYKGTNTLVTEIVYWDKRFNRLSTPLYDYEKKQTIITMRTTVISSKDINGDGTIEIPFTVTLQSPDPLTRPEGNYYTVWQCYDEEARSFYPVVSTVINYSDGYYIVVPDGWDNTVQFRIKNDTRNMVLYGFVYPEGDINNRQEEKIAEIQVFSYAEWEKIAESTDYQLIAEINGIVYAGRVEENDTGYAISFEELKNNFHLIGG